MKPIPLSIVAILLVASACSGASNEIADPTPPSVAPTSTPAPPSTQPTTTGSGPDASDSSEPIAPVGDIEAAWIAMWDGTELVVSDPAAAREQITAVATDEVFELLDTLFNPDIAGDEAVGASPRVFSNHPVIIDTGDGSVAINDCINVTPLETAPFVWYSGVARFDGDAWRIEQVSPEVLSGCVPGVLADEAIAAYEAHWDARTVFWDPADPQHPLVEETTTGTQLELIRGLLVDHQERGLVLRGRAETHPEVVQIASATELTILDCMVQDPDRGVYDAATGERTEDIAPIGDGQRDLRSTVMVLEHRVWKVSDIQGQANVTCDTAPTVQGLPAV